MKVKIIVSNSKEEHEQKMNDALNVIGHKKMFFVHKLLKADKAQDGMRYVAFIHYE